MALRPNIPPFIRALSKMGTCSFTPFFNMTAVCTTSLPPTGIKQLLKQIETALGRKPEDKAHGIVKIDLDLLAYDGQILKQEDWKRPYVQEGVNELSQKHTSR